MNRWAFSYDIDRGSMMGDAVHVEVQAKTLLRAARLAHKAAMEASDCVERISLVGVERVNTDERERVIHAVSDIFSTRYRGG